MTTTAQRLRDRGLLELAQEVAELHKLPLDTVLGRSQARAPAAARHELWYRLRFLAGQYLDLSDIGRLFGRDHTTVLQGVRKHTVLVPEEQHVQNEASAALFRARQQNPVTAALQRARQASARKRAADEALVRALAADLRRIEDTAAELGMTLAELRGETKARNHEA